MVVGGDAGCGQHHEVGLDSTHSGQHGPPPSIGGPELSTGKNKGEPAQRQTVTYTFVKEEIVLLSTAPVMTLYH